MPNAREELPRAERPGSEVNHNLVTRPLSPRESTESREQTEGGLRDQDERSTQTGTAYRFTPRDSFTQRVSSSFVGVVIGPAEPPWGMKGTWVRVWRHAFDDELTMRLDGPGYAEGWPLVEPAPYTPTLPDRYLEQGRLAV